MCSLFHCGNCVNKEGTRVLIGRDPSSLIIHYQVQYVCWHPCASDILLSSGADSTINIWNTLTGEKVTEMRHANDLIQSVSFNYNGSHIAYTCKDKKLRVVKAHTGEIVSVSFQKL